jgi:hypothetical protein
MRGISIKALGIVGLLIGMLIADQPARAQLQLSNFNAAYGPFWPERKSTTYYQGKDGLFVRFVLSGFKPNDQGGFEVTSQIALENSAGETIKLQTLPLQGPLNYGKKSVIGYAMLPIDATCLPGEYKAIVTVKDKVSGQSAADTLPVVIKAEEWAISQIGFFTDVEHRVPTSLSGIVGETKWYTVGVIGFDHEGVDCQISVRILGPAGVEISKYEWDKGLKKEEIQSAFSVLTFSNNLAGFSAPGKYRLVITATDRIKNRRASCEFPFEIRLP